MKTMTSLILAAGVHASNSEPYLEKCRQKYGFPGRDLNHVEGAQLLTKEVRFLTFSRLEHLVESGLKSMRSGVVGDCFDLAWVPCDKISKESREVSSYQDESTTKPTVLGQHSKKISDIIATTDAKLKKFEKEKTELNDRYYKTNRTKFPTADYDSAMKEISGQQIKYLMAQWEELRKSVEDCMRAHNEWSNTVSSSRSSSRGRGWSGSQFKKTTIQTELAKIQYDIKLLDVKLFSQVDAHGNSDCYRIQRTAPCRTFQRIYDGIKSLTSTSESIKNLKEHCEVLHLYLRGWEKCQNPQKHDYSDEDFYWENCATQDTQWDRPCEFETDLTPEIVKPENLDAQTITNMVEKMQACIAAAAK